jgi:8-oxo-dGTP pyrophosphatase MutT (NUDIX family)
MPKSEGLRRPRTLLEQKIRERRLSFGEFTDLADRFARENKMLGTLSFRHLQRLAAGQNGPRSPLGQVRPATARLLEEIFDIPVERLLAPPDLLPPDTDLDPSSQEPRPLSVAVAIVVRESEILLVCRRSAHENDIMWQFPAGVIKPGMPSKSVAVRETLRETGVCCSVSGNLGRRVHPVTRVVCDYLLCEYVSGDAVNSDAEENLDVAWIAKDRLERIIPREHIYPPVLAALGVS